MVIQQKTKPLARRRCSYEWRGQQKIGLEEKPAGESPAVAVEDNQEEWFKKFWGDKLSNRNGNLRIVYNNVNGLKINEFIASKIKRRINRKKEGYLKEISDIQKVTGILSILDNWDANILCLAETQVAWENYVARNYVEKELRTIDRHAGMCGSSSATAGADLVKPGGTLTVYDGNWAGRIVNKGHDPDKLGRWSYITLRGRNSTYLTIITGYRVCEGQKSKHVGMSTAYMQQEILLRKKGFRKTPQEMFLIDMEKFIEDKIKEGHEIIMNLDANEEWESKNLGFSEMSIRLGLFDLAKERHGKSVPPTYIRKNSKRRLDYMMGSEKVMNNVTAFGMAPGESYLSLGDHRSQYIAVNVANILHLNIYDAISPSSRRLKSNDPKKVSQYIEKVKDNFHSHNVFQRIEELWDTIKTNETMSKKQIKTYEKIDRDVYRLCTNAENNIKFFQPRKFVWSPELDEAVKEAQYWEERKKFFSDKEKTKRLVRKGIKQGYCLLSDENTVRWIQEELKIAYTNLRKIQKKDVEKRIEYLHRLADKYALENNISKETAIKELLSHEEVREMFRTVRLRLEGARQPQLSEIWVRGGNDEKITLSESVEVEEHLLQRNKQHLQQAAMTPFATGELADAIHSDGSGEAANRIISGYEIEELHNKETIVKKYVQELAAADPHILNTVKVEIQHEEFKRFWINKRESTATSPFGLHIGHYKSVVNDKEILEVHRKLLMLPFKYAIIPQRWAKTIQIMLKKTQGSHGQQDCV